MRTTKVGGDASCSDEDKCKNILAARRDRGSFPAKQQRATARADAGVRTTEVGGDASCSDEAKCKNILAARRDTRCEVTDKCSAQK